jgi:DNA-binding transcriptional LysR family regulator
VQEFLMSPDDAGHRRVMTNIPTELLRTFVAVVDLRSFTRAAQSLGVTQPAVSAQVKRLQQLLGGDLMDKSAPGVMLTAMGEHVLAYARRLLAINDQILTLAGDALAPAQTIRIGMPGDLIGDALWRTLAWCRSTRSDVRFSIRGGSSISLLSDLRQGDLDLAVTVSGPEPHSEARFHWTEELVWVRAPHLSLAADAPVPIVGHGDKCHLHRQAMDALDRAGRAYTQPFAEDSRIALAAAVAAGLGTMVLPRCMAQATGIVVWTDAPLPRLPSVVCNVCVRTGADEIVEQVAGTLADAMMSGRAPTVSQRLDRAAG